MRSDSVTNNRALNANITLQKRINYGKEIKPVSLTREATQLPIRMAEIF